MKQTLLIILSSFLATAAVIKAAPAVAEPAPSNINLSIVRTADLDLSTDNGRRQLDQRLVSAAREVCGTASDVDLEGKNDVRQCRADALAKARSESEQLASRGSGTILVAARQ